MNICVAGWLEVQATYISMHVCAYDHVRMHACLYTWQEVRAHHGREAEAPSATGSTAAGPRVPTERALLLPGAIRAREVVIARLLPWAGGPGGSLRSLIAACCATCCAKGVDMSRAPWAMHPASPGKQGEKCMKLCGLEIRARGVRGPDTET